VAELVESAGKKRTVGILELIQLVYMHVYLFELSLSHIRASIHVVTNELSLILPVLGAGKHT
jgi:hypothetical protein